MVSEPKLIGFKIRNVRRIFWFFLLMLLAFEFNHGLIASSNNLYWLNLKCFLSHKIIDFSRICFKSECWYFPDFLRVFGNSENEKVFRVSKIDFPDLKHSINISGGSKFLEQHLWSCQTFMCRDDPAESRLLREKAEKSTKSQKILEEYKKI